MGRFDGILLCSDWDGTLFADATVPQNTVKAIEYFKAEGGLFSISSGRSPDYLEEMSYLLTPNTYCICYGGALIADIFTKDILHQEFIDRDALDVVDTLVYSSAKTKTVNIMLENGVIHHLCIDDYEKFKQNFPANVYKITLTGNSDADGEIYAKLAKEINGGKYMLARSYMSYIELMKTKNTKGFAAKKLKEKLGAKILVGMGDYENDIPLFKETDISFAVANAVPEIKNIATHTLSKCAHEGAAEEAINILDKIIQNY